MKQSTNPCSPCDTGSHVTPPPLTDAQVRRNRCHMTIIRYVISYPRWSFSLFLLLARLTLPQLSMPSVGVEAPLRALNHLVALEAEAYADCVRMAFEHTQPRLVNRTLQQENKRIEVLQKNNRGRLQRAREISRSCSDTTRSTRRALLQSPSDIVRLQNDTASCSLSDRTKLRELLLQSQDETAESSLQDAASAWDLYLDSTQDSLSRINQYAKARAQYDYEYFVGIHASVDLLNDFELSLSGISMDDLGILEQLRALLQAIIDALRDAHARVRLMQVRLELFHASMLNLHLHYTDVFGRFRLAADFVRDFVPNFISLPPFFDVSGLPTPDILLPVSFTVPDYTAGLPDIDTLIAEYLKQLVKLIEKVIVQVATTVAEETREAVEALLEALRELLTLEDYIPPKYVGSYSDIETPEDEMKHLDELGKTSKKKALSSLEKKAKTIDDYDQPAPTLPADLNYTSSSSDREARQFGYLKLQLPPFSLPGLFRTLFAWVFIHNWIVDLVLQFLRLWKLKRKYERNAQPHLPEIDYREEDDKEEEKEKEASQSTTQAKANVLKLFLSPWMALALVMLPVAGIYLGIYLPHVYSKCVATREGTFVARYFVAPLQINNANLVGNALYTTGEIACRRRHRAICNRQFGESDFVYRQDVAAWQTMFNEWNHSQETSGLMRRCIDTESIDQVFWNSCCGLERYGTECIMNNQTKHLCPIDNTTYPPAAFHPVGDYLSNHACQVDFETLPDARFDCRVMEDLCSAVPCNGVDSHLIQMFTVEAVCQVEVYIMGCCFWVLSAVYHMIAVGMGCSQLLSGVICVRWRSLRPDGLLVRMHMRESGELIRGKELKDRQAHIAIALRQYERTGWMQIVFGSMILLLWFISFCVLRRILAQIVR